MVGGIKTVTLLSHAVPSKWKRVPILVIKRKQNGRLCTAINGVADYTNCSQLKLDTESKKAKTSSISVSLLVLEVIGVDQVILNRSIIEICYQSSGDCHAHLKQKSSSSVVSIQKTVVDEPALVVDTSVGHTQFVISCVCQMGMARSMLHLDRMQQELLCLLLHEFFVFWNIGGAIKLVTAHNFTASHE